MVGVENYCALLDRVAGICAVCVDDVEVEVKKQWPVISDQWLAKALQMGFILGFTGHRLPLATDHF